MKIAVIGDVHGRTNWKRIDFGSYDRVIFMGDYCDPYAYNIGSEEVYNNFLEILKLKKAEPDKFVLLFGNHDLHYLVASRNSRERYSRFDGNLIQKYKLNDLLEEGLKDGTFQVAYSLPHTDLFFVHATISVRWYNLNILHNNFNAFREDGITSIGPYESDKVELETQLNKLLRSVPEAFYFNGPMWDMYGYADTQGPLWWRSMTEDHRGLQERSILKGIYQINGHTQVPDLDLNVRGGGAKVAFVDLLGSNKYTEITTVTDGYRYFFTEKQISDEAN